MQVDGDALNMGRSLVIGDAEVVRQLVKSVEPGQRFVGGEHEMLGTHDSSQWGKQQDAEQHLQQIGAQCVG